MIGVGNAVGVVMGNIVGLGDENEVQKYARESVKFGILTGLVVTLLTFVASFFAPAVFKNVTAETQEMSRGLIWLYALTAVIRTLNFMYVIGILRSGGDTTFCMVSETIILWVFSVPLVIVFGIVFKASLYVVFLMSMVSEVIKIIAFDIRIRKGKWIKFLENK
jgi:Na+-driven multidrug efflux pump